MATIQHAGSPSAHPEVGRAAASAPAAPLAYPPDALLTTEQVAAWLGVSPRSVQRYAMRRVQLGDRTVRYLAKHVYEYLESHAA